MNYWSAPFRKDRSLTTYAMTRKCAVSTRSALIGDVSIQHTWNPFLIWPTFCAAVRSRRMKPASRTAVKGTLSQGPTSACAMAEEEDAGPARMPRRAPVIEHNARVGQELRRPARAAALGCSRLAPPCIEKPPMRPLFINDHVSGVQTTPTSQSPG